MAAGHVDRILPFGRAKEMEGFILAMPQVYINGMHVPVDMVNAGLKNH